MPQKYTIDDTISGTSLGYSFKLDGRLHNHSPAHSGVYIGLGIFYNWFKHPHTGYFSDTQTLSLEEPAKDEYLLIKHTIGCVVQFGGHHDIGKHIDVDMTIGIGPKVMYTKQRGRTNPDDYYFSRHPNVHAIESRLGNYWSVAMQGQLSVGYILGD